MDSPYPRDDFDAVTPPRDGRRGAHRAAPRRSQGLVAPLVIAVVVAVGGGASWVALSTTGGSAAASGQSQQETAPADAGAAADDQAADGGAGAADDGGAAPDGAQVPAASEAPAEPDRSTPVVVLNGTGTKGLAAEEAAELTTGGWTVSRTDNATSAQRSAHSSTVVLYPDAALQASAEALAADAGASAVLDADAPSGTLTVVLR